MGHLRGLPGITPRAGQREEINTDRYGTPIQKGATIGVPFLTKYEEQMQNKISFYTAYPDVFVDEVLKPTSSNFKFLFMQRILMREIMRKSVIHVTAARGFSKTFTSLLALIIKCMLLPGVSLGFAAPGKKQSAEIVNEKIPELLRLFPLLEKEFVMLSGKDYCTLKFKNASTLEVTAPLDSTRGRRFSGLMIDETRDHDGQKVNVILLPTLVISRRTAGKRILNTNESHQCQIYTTSASAKTSYNYEKLIETFSDAIINPGRSAVFGFDYNVPIIEGLYTRDYIQSMMLSPTFNADDFAREYGAIYTSENEDSWFKFSTLSRRRKLANAEWSARPLAASDFYLLSVDVGRYNDQTACTVFKVSLSGNGRYRINVVNLYVLGRTAITKPFSVQATDIKRLMMLYAPKEVVIDTNGLGAAIADEMIKEHITEDGLRLPAYGFMNDDAYKMIQPKNAPRILYKIKANAELNSQMFSNCYSKIDSGQVSFLIKEQEARVKMLSTKKGQKMSTEEKTKRLMPYEMTSKLHDEIANLKLKQTGGNQLAIERINSRFPKDKFSSLIMGLWRIKEIEDIEYRKLEKRKKADSPKRQLIFSSKRR